MSWLIAFILLGQKTVAVAPSPCHIPNLCFPEVPCENRRNRWFASASNKHQTDTLKYDDGEAEGFYVVGDYENDKFGVKFLAPFPYYRVHGVLVFAEAPDGFTGAILCPDNGEPDTTESWVQLDSVYSGEKEWAFTPIVAELKDSGPMWFVMRAKARPGLGGDTDDPSGNSWCYSESSGWKQSNCNWLIRLIVENMPGYYEDFADSSAGYAGDWEFGVPSLMLPPEDNCFATRLDATYPDNTYLQLESPWIPVGNYGLSDPMLLFRHFYRTQYEYDGGNLKISKDAMSWELVSPVRGYDIGSLSQTAGLHGESGFSGDSDGWKEECFIFPLWDSLKIRWCFGSDAALNELGWFIDEVRIGQRPSRDVLPVSVTPRIIVPPQSTTTPSAVFGNLGMYSEGVFEVKCLAESCGIYVYEDVRPVSIEPGSTITVDFSPWNAANQGIVYDLRVCSNMPGDENPRNDTMSTRLLAFSLIDSIEAGFTELPPQIDGMIDSVEWRDATMIDGSDVLGIDSTDPCETCKLYFVNSNSMLYIGCKSESIGEFRAYVDESGDGQWDRDGSEGYYWITDDGYKFQDMYYHSVYPLPEILGSMSANGVEIGIPIGVHEPYQIPPTQLIRCFVQAKQSSEYTGWWPQDITSGHHNNPAYYAKIGITGVGVQEVETRHHMSLHVHPNPVNTAAAIEMHLPYLRRPGQSSETAEASISNPGPALSLELHDLAGRLIRVARILEPSSHEAIRISWNTSSIPSGVYFLVYKVDTARITKKIAILH